jgi:hypothetical protein
MSRFVKGAVSAITNLHFVLTKLGVFRAAGGAE